MNKKKIIYFLLEIIFAAINIILILYFKNSFFTNNQYDYVGVISSIIIVIVLMILFMPPINKIAVTIFVSLYLLYLSGQHNYFKDFNNYYRFSFSNLFKYGNKAEMILIFTLCLVFVVLYFVLQRKVFNEFKTIKYRLIAPALLAIPLLLIFNRNSKIIAPYRYGSHYNINETPYYSYLHINNGQEFVDKYGIFTYLDRDLYLKENTNENDSKDIQEYLESRGEIVHSRYHGIFENKNVIFIQLNNFGFKYIPQDIAPNINEYFNNSLRVSGFNTPVLNNKEVEAEFLANTSLIPDNNLDLACYKYDENYYLTTLPKIFKFAGYATDYFINDFDVYFNRTKMVEAYGYDEMFPNYKMGGNDMSLLDYADRLVGFYTAADYKLMSYWLIQYDANALDSDKESYILSKYPDIEEEELNYYANAMKLDEVLSLFINKLKETNRLEDTVIVMFGDGGVKKYTTSELFFYNDSINDSYPKATTLVDLLPSVADLWNLPYDNQSIIGHNLFDDNYQGIDFELDSNVTKFWYNNKGLTEYLNFVVDAYDANDLENVKEDFNKFRKEIDISFKILRNDYFRNK